MSADIRALGGVDPHDVLGVRRGASPQQVTRAFHREALRGGHPDTGGDAYAFRRLVVARDALLSVRTSPGGATPATPAAAPRATEADRRPPQAPGPVRPAPPSSDASALPLIVLLFLAFVVIPHVLLAVVLVVIP